MTQSQSPQGNQPPQGGKPIPDPHAPAPGGPVPPPQRDGALNRAIQNTGDFFKRRWKRILIGLVIFAVGFGADWSIGLASLIVYFGALAVTEALSKDELLALAKKRWGWLMIGTGVGLILVFLLPVLARLSLVWYNTDWDRQMDRPSVRYIWLVYPEDFPEKDDLNRVNRWNPGLEQNKGLRDLIRVAASDTGFGADMVRELPHDSPLPEGPFALIICRSDSRSIEVLNPEGEEPKKVVLGAFSCQILGVSRQATDQNEEADAGSKDAEPATVAQGEKGEAAKPATEDLEDAILFATSSSKGIPSPSYWPLWRAFDAASRHRITREEIRQYLKEWDEGRDQQEGESEPEIAPAPEGPG